MKIMSERLSVVIPKELHNELEELQKIMRIDKSTLIRLLLNKSVQELRIGHAIEEYKKGKITFGKASELAGLNIWEWIDEVHKQGVQSTFSLEDAREELDRWKKSKKNKN